ncbi:MAG TPA: hypothetical protein VFG69_02285, partial [Nannocystaceae bacterium]|nr:hypothetical protein [Nannocystaceae bacterium]
AALEAGDAVTALARFEDAYFNYTPERHKFNFNIGVAAHLAGDCVKAKAAFQRFLDLVPEDPNRGEAQLKILEIDRSGCANVAPTTTTPPPTTTAPATDDSEDAPILTSRRSEREDVIERERTTADAKKTHPMVIAGAVMTGVGAGLTIGGIVAAVLANRTANKLADLASPGPTGFPAGDYADDEVFDLDRNKLRSQNIAYLTMLPLGGVILVSGIVVLAVGVKKQKAARRSVSEGDDAAPSDEGEDEAPGRDEDARLPKVRFVGGGPTLLRGGAGVGATLRF